VTRGIRTTRTPSEVVVTNMAAIVCKEKKTQITLKETKKFRVKSIANQIMSNL